MKRIVSSILLLLLFSVCAGAQTFTTTGSAEVDVNDNSTVSVQVSGTFTGLAVAFEVSNNGTNWDAISCETPTLSATSASSTSSTGHWICLAGGVAKFRARVAAIATGSVTLTLNRSKGMRFHPQPVASNSIQSGAWSVESTIPNTVSVQIQNLGSNFVLGQGSAFSVTTASFTPPATPTDNCVLTGSASTTIKVIAASIGGTATAARVQDFFLIKRGAANTAGTFVAATVVPHDPDVASVAPTVGHYTANPTINGTTGTINRGKVLLPIAATVSTNSANLNLIPNGAVIELNGIAQQLAINYNGAALVGGESFYCHFSWIEESE